jgi:uncharacterized protein
MANSTLLAQIKADIKVAMIAKDSIKLTTLRMALASINNLQHGPKKEAMITDDMVMTILVKMIKQRKDAHTAFLQGDRPDLASKELTEIKVLMHYLPALPSEEELNQRITLAIQESQATNVKDLGKVIKAIKQKTNEPIDWQSLAQKVKNRLLEDHPS